jgi:hypothetical protein
MDKDIEETRRIKNKTADVKEAVAALQDLFAETSAETAISAMLSYLGQLMYMTGVPIATAIQSLSMAFGFYEGLKDRDDS